VDVIDGESDPLEVFALYTNPDAERSTIGRLTSAGWEYAIFEGLGGQARRSTDLARLGPNDAVAASGVDDLLRFHDGGSQTIPLPIFEASAVAPRDGGVLVGSEQGRFAESLNLETWSVLEPRASAGPMVNQIQIRVLHRVAPSRYLVAGEDGFLAMLHLDVDDPTMEETISEICGFERGPTVNYNFVVPVGEAFVAGGALEEGVPGRQVLTWLIPR
jgi:hypothetical protein